MSFVTVYLRIYADCLQKALGGISKNLWTLLLPMGLALALQLLTPLLATLGLVGGILLGLAIDAAVSCYLYFTGEVVANARVGLKDFQKSIGAYFWSIMNLFFVFWLARLVVRLVAPGPTAHGILSLGLSLLIALILNAAPEIIYRKGSYGGIETITRCVRFIQENWIEWLVPNVLLMGAMYLLWTAPPLLVPYEALVRAILLGALIHVLMVFRGHLFAVLDGSNHRQRMFRFRNGL